MGGSENDIFSAEDGSAAVEVRSVRSDRLERMPEMS